jgi:spermidine synthase
MLLLGAVSPLLVTGIVRGQVPVGRAAGSVGALGTLGSLAGTFVATHWLVPEFGCRLAIAAAAGLLIVGGFAVAGSGARRGAAAVLFVLIATSAVLHGGPLRPPPAGRELLAERESRYQFLQVLRDAVPDGADRTVLVINEGLDSFHSIDIAGSALTGGAYYDWQAVAPLLAGDGQRPDDLRALSIGDAAGSLRSVYAGVHPGARVDGVDIDPLTGELGRQFFDGAKAAGDAFVVDGRVFVARTERRWNVIHVDAYAHQVYVPAHLASREFFAETKRCLLPDGVVACNVGALHASDPVLRAIGTTMAAVFGHAIAFAVPASRNFVLVARNGSPPEPSRLADFEFGGENLVTADLEHWRGIVAAAADPVAWIDVGTGGELLVDDRPVLDQLLYSAGYLNRRDDGIVVLCEGVTDAAGAEATAYADRVARRWDAVLQTVRGSRRETAFLRRLAGDARWGLRQMASAVAEYERGLQLEPDAATRAGLEQSRDAALQQLVPLQRADWFSTRNAWLAVGTAIGMCASAWAVARLYR